MAKETLKHYVEFLYPGSFFNESSTQEVEARDPSVVQTPREAFGYAFFDRQEYVAQDGEVLVGRPRNRSGMHYFGKLMSLAEVKREVPNSDILQSNMKSNGLKRVVKTRRGNFQPFNKNDVLVADE
ncbi:MAG: hypothetical protein AABW89_03165 [Nanoarchaeota archaeon]